MGKTIPSRLLKIERFARVGVLLCLAGSLAGCSKPKDAEPAAVDSAKTAVSVEKREWVSAVREGEIQSRLQRTDILLGSWIGFGRASGSWIRREFALKIENRSKRNLAVSFPRHLLATMEGWKNPHADEARAPEFFYYVGLPPKAEFAVEAGQSAAPSITNVWYLGNAGRLPPSGSEGNVTRFDLKPAPADSIFVRLAERLEADRAPTRSEIVERAEVSRGGGDGPSRRDAWVGLAFTMVAGATPEKIVHDGIVENPFPGTKRLRETLRAIGHESANHPAFDEANKKREGIVAALNDGIARGDASGLAPLWREGVLSCCEGDAEIAVLVAKHLRPKDPAEGESTIPVLLERMDARDPAILDALFQFALKDGNEFGRMKAAVAAVKLGDSRCVPILAQYNLHPETEDSDVVRVMAACNETLKRFWKGRGVDVEHAKWADLLRQRGGADAPELKGAAPSDIGALKAFLASEKNLRAGAFEQLCADALQNADVQVRRRALDRLARNKAYNSRPKSLEVHLAIIRGETNKGLRCDAIGNLALMNNPPGAEAALIEVLKSYHGVDLEPGDDKLNADRNLRGIAMQILSNMKSRAAVPELLPFLDGGKEAARRAGEALSDITNLRPKEKTRAAWEAALREAKWM